VTSVINALETRNMLLFIEQAGFVLHTSEQDNLRGIAVLTLHANPKIEVAVESLEEAHSFVAGFLKGAEYAHNMAPPAPFVMVQDANGTFGMPQAVYP